MRRLDDAINNMLRETLARGDIVAPVWRGEILAVTRDLVAKEREACAKVCESIILETSTRQEAHSQAQGNARAHDCANSIRMRLNGQK